MIKKNQGYTETGGLETKEKKQKKKRKPRTRICSRNTTMTGCNCATIHINQRYGQRSVSAVTTERLSNTSKEELLDDKSTMLHETYFF